MSGPLLSSEERDDGVGPGTRVVPSVAHHKNADKNLSKILMRAVFEVSVLLREKESDQLKQLLLQ